MRHDQGTGRAKFDREIPIGYSIERVAADVVEPERACHALPVDREAGSGKRSGTQRQRVDALAAIGETRRVAPEHFGVRKQVMPKCHGLRHLKVGEAWHDGARVGERHAG